MARATSLLAGSAGVKTGMRMGTSTTKARATSPLTGGVRVGAGMGMDTAGTGASTPGTAYAHACTSADADADAGANANIAAALEKYGLPEWLPSGSASASAAATATATAASASASATCRSDGLTSVSDATASEPSSADSQMYWLVQAGHPSPPVIKGVFRSFGRPAPKNVLPPLGLAAFSYPHMSQIKQHGCLPPRAFRAAEPDCQRMWGGGATHGSEKILIVDVFSQASLDKLKAEGIDVIYDASLKEQKLTEGLKELKPSILVVRSTKVQAPQLEAAAPNLKYVIRAGSGYDTIDVKAAKEKGVAVSNTPGLNAHAVAELVWAHILQHDRNLSDNITQFRQGHWNKAAYLKARGIKGSTLGIVGFGNIGKLVARRGLAFEQNVLAYDPIIPYADIAKFGVVVAKDVDEIAMRSDFITLHVPGDGSTKNLVNAKFLSLLKKGTLVINTSRASVIDEPALIQAVKEKGIFAAVDVMSSEPAEKKGEFKHPFADVPGIYVTHHIGASTLQAEEAIGDEALKMISLYVKTKEILHKVN